MAAPATAAFQRAPATDGDGAGRVAIEAARVTAAYQVLLGRSPEGGEIDLWTGFLTGDAEHAAMTRMVAGSPEGRRRLVDFYYGPLLGRAGDPAGVSYWTSRLLEGEDAAWFQTAVLGSPEAYQRAGGTDRGWVSGLYEHPLLLGRQPDPSGLSHWLDVLATRGRGAVARSLVTSAEASRHAVDRAYERIVGNPPTPAERAALAPSYRRLGHDLWFLAAELLAGGLTPNASGLEADVRRLASDTLAGRQDRTLGSAAAQQYLIRRLREHAIGIDATATGNEAFTQRLPGGTNILAMIPGTDLADEHVVVGAHYDHLGVGCRGGEPGDGICNGATDNAAGVAAVLEVARRLDASESAPRRTVVFAFWAREEDGLVGSHYYTENPPVPLSSTVGYLNFDIWGANLLPSLRSTSFAVGSESGGAALSSMVEEAVAEVPLDTKRLSTVFGQYRSDYVWFLANEVPTVFFSDSTGPCYHTAQDEPDVVDFAKLGQQSRIAHTMTRELARVETPPSFATGPETTYEDVVALSAVAEASMADIDRFSEGDRARIREGHDLLATLVAEGAEAFDAEDGGAVISTASSLSRVLTRQACEGFQHP